MKSKKILFTFLTSILLSAFVFAEAPVIKGFNFSGNERTKTDFLEEMFEGFIGAPAEPEVMESFEKSLELSGLFSEYKTEVTDDGIINVTVVEKIYYLPMPMFSYDGNSFTYGAFVMDTNLFGRRHTLVAGGMFSDDMMKLIAIYAKPPRPGKTPGFSSSSIFTRDTVDFKTMGDSKLFKFTGDSFNQNLTLHVPLTNGFSLGIGGTYSYSDYDNNFHDTIHRFGLRPSVSWQSTDWNGVFAISNGIHFNSEIGYTTTNEMYENVSLRIVFQHCPLQKLRLYNIGASSIQHNLPYPLLQTRDSVTSTIVSSNFHSSKFFGITTGLEGAIVKTNLFSLSLYGQYEILTAEKMTRELAFNQGFNLGTRIYLSTIAVPAFSMGFAYNITEKLPMFSINMGASF